MIRIGNAIINEQEIAAAYPDKPDTDNLVKLLKDVMTKLGFWHDDAQVALEIIEKIWDKRSGLYVSVEALE